MSDCVIITNTVATDSGTLLRLSAYTGVALADPSASFRGVVYEDVAGIPGNLIALGDVVSNPATRYNWIDLPFSGAEQIAVANASAYWIGYIYDRVSYNGGFERRTGASGFTTFQLNSTTTAPDPWAGGTTFNDVQLTINAVIEAGGGGGPAFIPRVMFY